VFRRLVVEARAGDAVRRIALGRRTKLPVEVDTRPFADGKDTYEAVLADLPGPVSWRVVYERVQHPLEEDGLAASVEGAIEVAAGAIP